MSNSGASSGSPQEVVYVSGMPLMLRGFNGAYVKSETSPDTYNLVKHNYYGIRIVHVALVKKKDHWVLEGVWGQVFDRNYSESVFHDWSDGMRVTRHEDSSTWWNSNSGIVKACALVGVVALALWRALWSH